MESYSFEVFPREPYVDVKITTRHGDKQLGFIEAVYRTDKKRVKKVMNNNSVWIETFWVSDMMRGKGIGSMLLCKTSEFFKEKGFSEIHLQAVSEEAKNQNRLFKYYESFGFRRREPFEYVMYANIDSILSRCNSLQSVEKKEVTKQKTDNTWWLKDLDLATLLTVYKSMKRKFSRIKPTQEQEDEINDVLERIKDLGGEDMI